MNWLEDFVFCPHKVQLHLDGVKIAPSAAALEGQRVHAQLEEDFLAKASDEFELAEAFEASKLGVVRTREHLLRSEVTGLIGRLDELRLTPVLFLVIDDKPARNRVMRSWVLQAWGYCTLLQDNLPAGESRPIHWALRERGTENWIGNGPRRFTPENREEVVRVVDRIWAAIRANSRLESTTNRNKCRACSARSECASGRLVPG